MRYSLLTEALIKRLWDRGRFAVSTSRSNPDEPWTKHLLNMLLPRPLTNPAPSQNLTPGARIKSPNTIKWSFMLFILRTNLIPHNLTYILQLQIFASKSLSPSHFLKFCFIFLFQTRSMKPAQGVSVGKQKDCVAQEKSQVWCLLRFRVLGCQQFSLF